MDRLERFQRRAAKIILRRPLFVTSNHDELLATIGWPSLASRRKYFQAVLVYRMATSDVPKHLRDYIPSKPTHMHNTRKLPFFQLWDGTFWAGSEFVPEVFPFSSAARLCRPLGPRPEYTFWLRPEYTLWRTVQVQLAPGRLVSYLFRLFEGKRQCGRRVSKGEIHWTVGEDYES